MDKRDGFDLKEARIRVRCNSCGRNHWTLTLPETAVKEIIAEGTCFCGEKYKVTVSVEWLTKNNSIQ